jgi:hypothetical protein
VIRFALSVGLGLAVTGCGSGSPRGTTIPEALVRQARPIGHGARFHPPAAGPVLGPCRARLGPRAAVHVELFAANRVVLVGTGIGTRGPRRLSGGRIVAARCYGALVTLEPTGVILVRPRAHLTVGDLFRSWGQPLTSRRTAGFPSRSPVTAYVDGHRHPGPASRIPLTRHAEIVLEVGPHVPPHALYHFPPGE